jgi:ribosomal protein S10
VTRSLTGSRKRRRAVIDTAFTGQDELPTRDFAGNGADARPSLDDLFTVIASLRDTINQQSGTIDQLRFDVKAIQDQNKALSEDVKSLQTQLKERPAPTGTGRTWAAIAEGGQANTKTTKTTKFTNPNPHPTTSPAKESACVRISTREQTPQESETIEAHTFRRYMRTETANEKISKALRDSEKTKDIQIAGVATTKTGYIVRFRDEQSAKIARNDSKWLKELGNDTKLVTPRFGVVVHRVPTQQVDDKEGKGQSIDRITEENDLAVKGFQVRDIAWLKSKEKPWGRSASLGVWFDTAEAAKWTIDNGLVFGQRYIGSIEAYQLKKKRCHRCQRPGHLAWSCREKRRCGHCAREHERKDCPPGATAACVDCTQAHPTGSKECTQNALNSRSL